MLVQHGPFAPESSATVLTEKISSSAIGVQHVKAPLLETLEALELLTDELLAEDRLLLDSEEELTDELEALEAELGLALLSEEEDRDEEEDETSSISGQAPQSAS